VWGDESIVVVVVVVRHCTGLKGRWSCVGLGVGATAESDTLRSANDETITTVESSRDVTYSM